MISFLLTILYFVLFGIVIYRVKWFKDEHLSRHWLLSIFGIKIIASVILTAIYTNYYTDRDTADIYKYFDDSLVIFNALKESPMDYIQMVLGLDFNHEHLSQNYYDKMLHWTRPFGNDLVSDSHVIIRFNAFLRLFSFGQIMVHNVFINFLSFSGIYLLFKHYKPYAKGKEKLLALVLVVLPSVLFWGSGLLKEGLLLFALAIVVRSFHKLLNKFSLKHILLLCIGMLLLTFTKFYLLVVLVIPFGFLASSKWLKFKPWMALGTSSLLFLLTINLLPFVHQELDIVNQISMKQQSFSNFIKSVPAHSGFEINQLTDGYSILKNMPNALINTFIRPYPWECTSPFGLLSSLENLLVLCCIFIAIRYRANLSEEMKRVVFFNLSFVIGLYLLIGLTTPVFGAIVRYKIPGLLFLFVTLVIVIDKNRLKTMIK